MAKYKILYWHDIPTQVRATDANGRVGKQLPKRFQIAVDEAAMKAGLVGDDKYTAEFEWSAEEERSGTADEVAEAVVAELDKKYPEIDWQATARKLENR